MVSYALGRESLSHSRNAMQKKEKAATFAFDEVVEIVVLGAMAFYQSADQILVIIREEKRVEGFIVILYRFDKLDREPTPPLITEGESRFPEVTDEQLFIRRRFGCVRGLRESLFKDNPTLRLRNAKRLGV